MLYRIYRITYIGIPRDHHAIFVETHEDGPETGFLYQVVGDIQNGMEHEHKPAKKPENSATFLIKDYLGTVSVVNYPRVKDICDEIAPPKKQFQLNKRLYPEESIRRCQEWTEEAIRALIGAGVLQEAVIQI